MTEGRISLTEVEHVARLARLALGPEEKARMQGQLDAILSYVARLHAIDTTDVPPMAHVLPLVDVMREDEPRSAYPVEAMLANAPDRAGDGFSVPRILEDVE